MDCPDSELSLVFVDDADIEKLNKQYLQRGGPTNVIAFAMREGAFADLSPHVLGDVVISVETAAREAQRAGISLQDRLTALMIHGILHLLGYAHENDDEKARVMQARSEALLARVQQVRMG